MIAPYNTDAPLYHFPYATIGMIVVNTLVWLGCMSAEPEDVVGYLLTYGDGLHPIQWVTSNFIHDGFFHLLGNMITIWAFGLVVEGKVGWLGFLAIYLGIGVAECAVEQTIMLGAEEGASLGASSIAFGLMAISLVWAPRNDMHVVYYFGIFGAGIAEIPILVYSGLTIAMETIFAMIAHVPMSSQIMHLMGAFVGAGVGVALLKLNLVDCENWDIFAVIGKREGESTRKRKKKRRRKAAREQDEGDEDPAAPIPSGPSPQIERLRIAIENNNLEEAFDRYAAISRTGPVPEPESVAFIKALHDSGRWADSVPLMAEYLKNHTAKATVMRLKLAEILITKQQRPQQALRLLAKLDGKPLSPAHEKAYERMKAVATSKLDDAPMELEVEDW